MPPGVQRKNASRLTSKAKRKPNAGRFRQGDDSRRHKLTKRDCRKGYRHALKAAAHNADLYAWLHRKVRAYYSKAD